MGKVIDERFHRYGKLTVLNRANNKDGRATWFCRCDCGNFTIVEGTSLRRGITKSCGCLKRNGKPYYLEDQSAFNRVLSKIKRSAEKRNIKWSLTDNQARDLFSQPCYYCGAKPRIHEYLRKEGFASDFPYNGIDRVDNSKGYSVDNTVPCCTVCNFMKHTLSKDIFEKQVFRIYKHLNLQDKYKEKRRAKL